MSFSSPPLSVSKEKNSVCRGRKKRKKRERKKEGAILEIVSQYRGQNF
jgi:hypothetical protein